jgi:hypothetical protein
MPPIYNASRGFLVAAALSTASATLADDRIEIRNYPVKPTGGYSLQADPLIRTGGQTQTGAQLPAAAADSAGCVCTNLANVSVICTQCDQETDANLCHTHDQACQDTAQLGGIREGHTFYCTTLAQ